MHILIVEDDPDQYRAMRQTLERQGWTTDVATLPREALRKFDAQPPDLVLLDLSLADKRLSGYDVLSTIRNRPGGDEILIVILSGQKEPAEQVRGLRLGADDYWTKPMVPELLVERVLKVLSRKLQSVGPVKREWRQGDVLIRLANEGAITRSGVTLKLNREETQFLALLLEKPGAYVSSAELKRVIWQNHVIESALRIMVFRLRKRLVNIGLSAEAVVGHRDRGYRIDLDAFEEGGA